MELRQILSNRTLETAPAVLAQQQAILEMCADEARLAATPVNEFVDLFVI